MLPKNDGMLREGITFAEPPTRTYRLDIARGVISGYVDRQEAMRQAVYLILQTERYRWIIYSWNYGVELEDLFGKRMDYIMAEAKRRIAEALLQDTRITGVDGWAFEASGESLRARFTVHTVFGEVEGETALAA